ncbi:MAG: aminoacyl-tRNA hydrolase [Patescibacteria group bacterium]
MRLIVGLGNPGRKYENTRHNAGFMAADLLAVKLSADEFKEEKKFKAMITKTGDVIIAKPLTFMNISGEAVSLLLGFYKLTPDDLIVVYDDVDLPLGTIRVRAEGSAGTHNGMRSIIQQIGTEKFSRVRIGIESRGLQAPQEQSTESFVLEPFLPGEKEQIASAITQGVSAITKILADHN